MSRGGTLGAIRGKRGQGAQREGDGRRGRQVALGAPACPGEGSGLCIMETPGEKPPLPKMNICRAVHTSELQDQIYFFPAVRPWGSHYISLNPRFLIWKIILQRGLKEAHI